MFSLVTWFSSAHLNTIPCLFIQEKLDFAIHDIIFDLLSIGRTSRQMCPEVLHWKLLTVFMKEFSALNISGMYSDFK